MVAFCIPQESTATDGLRFQVYFLRLRTLFNLSEEAGLTLLPSHREPWIYYEGAGPDYEGFQGFFSNGGEIDRFLDSMAKSQKSGAT